jgi:hypothetical protein
MRPQTAIMKTVGTRPGRYKRRTCRACGTVFTTTRIDARYCSPACRQRSYRDRRDHHMQG